MAEPVFLIKPDTTHTKVAAAYTSSTRSKVQVSRFLSIPKEGVSYPVGTFYGKFAAGVHVELGRLLEKGIITIAYLDTDNGLSFDYTADQWNRNAGPQIKLLDAEVAASGEQIFSTTGFEGFAIRVSVAGGTTSYAVHHTLTELETLSAIVDGSLLTSDNDVSDTTLTFANSFKAVKFKWLLNTGALDVWVEMTPPSVRNSFSSN